ncbi:MAG TPA: type II secretion system F family protein [Chloroflexota bacterium]|nr:type II secretion system F family protein [Chloroflexota bacterium]
MSVVTLDPRVVIAIGSGLGMALLGAGLARWLGRRHMQLRLRTLASQWSQTGALEEPLRGLTLRDLARRLGTRLGARLPGEVGLLATRVDRAGLAGRGLQVEILGWKAVGLAVGGVVGLIGLAKLGAPGAIVLLISVLVGWFGIDVVLARRHAQRRRAILHDLPTVMDLLVLSLEAGMGLDRAMRTVAREYRSALSDEMGRVLTDLDLGVGRGDAFERMAARVGVEDLQAVSRAIVQSEELGVSLVGVMQNQCREVRMSRRRAAEAEALRTPVKMLIPLVVFILPTLFMLLLGPVGLRAGAAFTGAPVP